MLSLNKSQRIGVFLGVSIGNFVVLLDTSILNVALPRIQQVFGASNFLLPWAAISYTIVFASLLLAAGAVSDKFGSLRVYRVSLFAFAVMSIGCAAAQNIGVLIGFRALLGAAAASMIPASIALLAQLYPDPKARAGAIGIWAAITSAGLFFGPILGGILTELASWRFIFLINPPVVAIALILVMNLANKKPETVRSFDLPGIILSIIFLGSASYGFISSGIYGWGNLPSVMSLILAGLSIILLIAVERRSKSPILPPALFANKEVTVAALATSLATLVFYGMLFSLTIWYQKEQGSSPAMTGLAFVPMTLPMCFLPIITGRMVAAFGARKVIIFGLVCDVLAGALLIGIDNSSSWLIWVMLSEIALVLASTTVIPAGTAQVSISAPIEYAASAQGALNAGRQAGAALGVAILGPLTSIHTIGWILACLSAMVLALTTVLGRSKVAEPSINQQT
jgi:DHA2 family methylenomycin A resistance protein-like MFS transporter